MSQTCDQLLAEAEQHPTKGWDFSWLGERKKEQPLPWDFTAMVAERACSAGDMLDMGTGGGEWLAELPHRPPHTVATEGWAPNLPVARERLAPLGIEVFQIEGAPDNILQDAVELGGELPFADGSFDLVTNRHEAFLAGEVARVLRSGGLFLTQQVGDGGFAEFHDLLGAEAPEQTAWRLPLAIDQVERAGLSVNRSAEGNAEVTFADVGALAWYLKMIPWTVPDFSIDRYRGRLHEIQEQIEVEGPVTLPLPGFYLEAVKV